ncbi:hypothetical protein TWF106_007582 [Orbilia oligospora]|uniref:Protein kinase domain-containing protein n=1 Tax=Orbilia oligospora TaxID=2813651 RepID=A0A7C8QQ59_ORBOL|nr:hypothetical protein TWF106_007582 [Orbilia oligospora]
MANTAPGPCCFQELRKILEVGKEGPAVNIWPPQLWIDGPSNEFHTFFPVKNLRHWFENEDFHAIFKCGCVNCYEECGREIARGFMKPGLFDRSNQTTQIKHNVLDDDDLCRIFGLLIECKVPRYIVVFRDYLEQQPSRAKGKKFTREELEKITGGAEESVLQADNIKKFLKRQHCYFEEPIPWNLDGYECDPIPIKTKCALPIADDVSPVHNTQVGGAESHVLKFNLLPESLSGTTFKKSYATLIRDGIHVDLKQKHPFVIKLLLASPIPRNLKLQTYKKKQRFDGNCCIENIQKYICMDISFFKYGERLCLIYPRALGTLEHLLTGDFECPSGDITSLNLWRQLKKVSEGIAFIHKSLKTQHLDLKPDNILIFEEYGSSVKKIGKGSGPASPLSTSSTRSPLPGNFTGDAIFMISDFGYQVPGSDPSVVVPGAGKWGPPEGPHNLSVLPTNEANELYDHWSFGAILLEAAVYDRAREPDEESDAITVGDFRYQRANLDKGLTPATTLKFYGLGENGENVLRRTVSDQIANMERLEDSKLSESQNGYTRMPAKFYRDIAGDIRRLLSIPPEKRKSEKGIMSIDPYEYYREELRTNNTSFSHLVSQSGLISPNSEHLRAQNNNSSVTTLDGPARNLDLNQRETLWDSKREFEFKIWRDQTEGQEVVRMLETPHRQDSSSTRALPEPYYVQDISLPGADSRGPWAVTCRDLGLRECSFADKDGEDFFHRLSGIRLLAGPFIDTCIEHFEILLGRKHIWSSSTRHIIEESPATLWFLTHSPYSATPLFRYNSYPNSSNASLRSSSTNLTSRTGRTQHTSRTDISRSKHKPTKFVTRNRAWLWIVPNHLEGSADKHPDGYLLDITGCVSQRRHGGKVRLHEESSPGKQARIMKYPYKLGVPLRIENLDKAQPCRDISFSFSSNESEFRSNLKSV